MSQRYPLRVKPGASNIGDSQDPADHPYDDNADGRRERDISLQIFGEEWQPFSFLLTLPREPSLWSLPAMPSRLTAAQVNNCVQNCRRIWHEKLLEYVETADSPEGQRNDLPFCDSWDLKGRNAEWLRRIIGPLAVAGNQMFHCLFLDRDRGHDLNEIGNVLKSLSCDRELYITVQSDTCYVPWWMIYTHPDHAEEFDRLNGTNYKPHGFWGYRHVIEQVPIRTQLVPKLSPANGSAIYGSINYDESIDEEFKRLGIECVTSHLKDIAELKRWAKPVPRRTKAEFQQAICQNTFQDELIYFFCHGEGSGNPGQRDNTIAKILLSDRDPIDPILASEIEYWHQNPFDPPPIVFINACQGGQVTPFFYDALVPVLLRQHAMSVIGPQIDIPALFAAEFAERFFRHLLHDVPAPRIAKLVRDLTRELLDKHCNPLGLVYSVYRGIDCYVEPHA